MELVITPSGSDANSDIVLGHVLYLLDQIKEKKRDKKTINILTSTIEHSALMYLFNVVIPILSENI